MGDSNQSAADKMSPASDEISANHQSEEYDEPTVESDVEEESRGEIAEITLMCNQPLV